MKKQRVKKFLFLCITNFTVVSIFIATIFLLPLVFIYSKKNDNSLSDKFFGSKSSFQGIVTLWNVDTFEGGTASRENFLEKVAVEFERQNKGVLIKVENLSLEQFNANLKAGKIPDIFTYGMGVSNYLSKYMTQISLSQNNLKSNFYASGLKNGQLLAVPWAFGCYSLITTVDRLDKFDLSYQGQLRDVAFNLAQDITNKKKTKHIYSLTLGTNQFTSSVDAFSRVFENGLVGLVQNGVVDSDYSNQTSYQAYVNFISNKANCLLGTTRDIARMQNRLKAGSESFVYYDIVSEYTDLVCFASITTQNLQLKDICNNFINLLISSKIQQKISSIGLFSPTKEICYKDDLLYASFEQLLNEQTVVKNVFL